MAYKRGHRRRIQESNIHFSMLKGDLEKGLVNTFTTRLRKIQEDLHEVFEES